jgi:hypothetical protein
MIFRVFLLPDSSLSLSGRWIGANRRDLGRSLRLSL